MKISQDDKQAIEQIMDRVGGGPGMRGILKSLFYWHGVNPRSGQKRMRIKKSGFLWIAKSANEWGDEANIRGTTARKLLVKLEKAGIIEKHVWYFGHFKKIHARLVEDPYPEVNGQEYRMPEKPEPEVPVEYRQKETPVPVASGTRDRSLYKQLQTSTNSTTPTDKITNSKSHPQTELSEKWQNLKSLIQRTATDKTIREFSLLQAKALPGGNIIVYGDCSDHLMRLIRAKFGAIEFLAA